MKSTKHLPRKRFGQHFLVDTSAIRKIVDAVAPRTDDLVVEIGPGLGAITLPLMERHDHLHVVEIDRDIAGRLRSSQDPAKITIHEADALRFDFTALGSDLRIVGNLPYNISTPLLFHIAASTKNIRDCHARQHRRCRPLHLGGAGEWESGHLLLRQHQRQSQIRPGQ